jgi:hypothetical protein
MPFACKLQSNQTFSLAGRSESGQSGDLMGVGEARLPFIGDDFLKEYSGYRKNIPIDRNTMKVK